MIGRIELREFFDALEWGKLRNQRLNIGFGCITCVNTCVFSWDVEGWERGRFRGWRGNSRLKFKMPIKHSGGNDKEICYEFPSQRGIWVGVRDMTISSIYVWPQSIGLDEIILPQSFSVPMPCKIESKCLDYPLCLINFSATGIEEPWWECSGMGLRAEAWDAITRGDWVLKRSVKEQPLR